MVRGLRPRTTPLTPAARISLAVWSRPICQPVRRIMCQIFAHAVDTVVLRMQPGDLVDEQLIAQCPRRGLPGFGGAVAP